MTTRVAFDRLNDRLKVLVVRDQRHAEVHGLRSDDAVTKATRLIGQTASDVDAGVQRWSCGEGRQVVGGTRHPTEVAGW